MILYGSHRAAAMRVASTVFLAGALLALASVRAVHIERDIMADVRAGENAYRADSGLITIDAFPSDDRVHIPVPILARPASALPIVATVQLTGAPVGYVLTRSLDGCWRLPALGHCWRASPGDRH